MNTSDTKRITIVTNALEDAIIDATDLFAQKHPNVTVSMERIEQELLEFVRCPQSKLSLEIEITLKGSTQ